MSQLINHPQFGDIRVEIIKNEPWFLAIDVCTVLEHTNPSMAIKLLDEDERTKKSLGRQGDAWFVNESGLYNLIFRSNKSEAKKFRKWVTGEVLPAIRKYGKYDPKSVIAPISLQWYQNELCVAAGALIANNIMSDGNYNSLVKRKKLHRVRRSAANTPALVVFESLPERFKQLIKTKFGVLAPPKLPMTKTQLADVMADICKIEDIELRLSLLSKIIN